MFLLDTNICIYLIREKPASILKRFRKLNPGEVGISVITLCELEYGIENSSSPVRNREALNLFLLPLMVFTLTTSVAIEYGRNQKRSAEKSNRSL